MQKRTLLIADTNVTHVKQLCYMYTHSGVDSIVMNFVCYNKHETT